MDSERLRQVIHRRSGVLLDENKDYLLESRLMPILKEEKIDSYDRLADQAERDLRLLGLVIDAVTTQETRFFRDEAVYQMLFTGPLRTAMQERANFRIWSAGCATGQEPYSIAISILEMAGTRTVVTIDASDISEGALDRARRARYSEFELRRGVSDLIRGKYFTKTEDGYQLKDRVRSMVRFFRFNFQEPIENLQYDVIFFRNVAIYFDEELRERLFRDMFANLVPGGILVVGTAETPLQYVPEFHVEQSGPVRYYVKES